MAHGLFRKKSIPLILKEAEQGLSDGHGHAGSLRKVLGVRDLTFMGIALVTNLAAMPTRVTIPAFALSIVIDALVIISSILLLA